MTALDVLQRLQSANDGTARRRTLMLHRFIAAEPLVVVVYRLAGESAAPLGIMCGTDAAAPTVLVAPEPRSRELRFREVFNPFAETLNTYIADCAADHELVGNRSVCATAPQILVPNAATAEFVGPLIGRSLRYLRTDGEWAVPEATVLAGAHLTWIGGQASLPGSSVLLAATDLLRRHWVCGLSDLESEDLHVHLAWIDPPDATTGQEAAAQVELGRFDGSVPAAGPTPDPQWDRDVLDPLISAFNQSRNRSEEIKTVERLGGPIRAAVQAALAPTWAATWEAIELLRNLPVAPTVAGRWLEDRKDFTNHMDRVETGDVRFRTRDSVKQSAYMVSRYEAAQSRLEADEAFDDPLVLAGSVADGLAISGTVTNVANPDVHIELAGPSPLPVGTELYWTEQRGKCSVRIAETSSEAPYAVRLETLKGKTKYYPEIGDWVVYAPFKDSSIPPPKMPANVPWTHEGPEQPMPSPEDAA